MNKTKVRSFFIKTKFFWIGGIMGLAQQFLGRLDYLLYKGHDIISFSSIMGSLSFWAALILLLILRNASPKTTAHDIFLTFLGLDIFYYLYSAVRGAIICLIIYFKNIRELTFSTFIQNTFDELPDLIKWTVIGTAAAVWAYFAVKFLIGGKKKLYFIMLLPLFIVIAIDLFESCSNVIHFFIQEYNRSNGIIDESVRYSCPIELVICDVTALVLCIRKLRKNRITA